ncbi:hypothetical protein LT336_00758 [Spiroplasma sp. JKS002671]|uniref:hypothetical protein n=1 Tax=Spiroplasma attinicola TaxID=2904537 RepID=UPI002022A999|nr:hypothetical protein [Spiroplasma sp. JKS002671]MCL8211006.1 hypothetical protein [Spiroplasma sp. JKS002671]
MQSDKTTFPKDDTKNKKQTEANLAQDFNVLNDAAGDFKNQANAQHDPDLKQFFTEYQTKTVYFYQINRLFANQENNIKFSPNTIKIAFIDSDKVIVSTAFETSDYITQLTSRSTNNVNDNQTIFELADVKQLIIQENALPHNNQPFVISLNGPVTEANLDDLYIVNSYVEPLRNPRVRNTKSLLITKVKDFRSNNGYPIIVRIQKQFTSDTKITGIKIKYPQPMLFGNIKLIGQINGIEGYSKLLLDDQYFNFPLLSMPIETDPKVRLLQWWFSNQILPWELAKQFITEKSVLDLINIDPGTETRKEVIPNARMTQGIIATSTMTSPDIPPIWPVSGSANQANLNNRAPEGSFAIADNFFFRVRAIVNPLNIVEGYQAVTTSDNFGNIEIEHKDAPLIGTLERVLLNFLKFTFAYYQGFEGALYEENGSGNPANDLAILKQKFVGQKPEDVITNLYNEWVIKNPDYKNNDEVKIFKSIVMMLTKNILSKLSINNGLNDDFKILLPYYFELITKPIQHFQDSPWDFSDCKVILKSEYFDFTEDNGKIIVKVKNNDLSQNKLFHLDDNQFNWLPIINELEFNAIPSLLPQDWKLSDGEFTKYFTNLIIKKEKIELALSSLYGKLNSTLYSKFELFNILKNIISDEFILNSEKPLDTITSIEISGIFGNGNYELSLITSDKTEITINNLNLFSKNEKISLIKIEI